MLNNLKLIVNNQKNQIEEKQFFEKDELKIILSSFFSKKNFCFSSFKTLFTTSFKFLFI